mmetsp:Transcript_123318/g.354315  ORF Transcript_123318/g.354315 Transcript_123318/m.354315 type:complete len:384 (-) Transcript_123318:358-1509(-)
MGSPGLRVSLYEGIDLLHSVMRFGEDHLRDPVVRHGLLVIGILGLADLGCALHLLLHVRHGISGRLDLLLQILHGLFEVCNLRLQIHFAVVVLLGAAVVLVEFVDAPVTVRHFVLLLLAKLLHHLVDFGLDLRECVKLGPGCQQSQPRLSAQCGTAPQSVRRASQPVLFGRRVPRQNLQECRVNCPREIIEGLVLVQDLDCLRNSGNFRHAVFDACVELYVSLRTTLLKMCKESAVQIQLSLSVLEFFERLGMFSFQLRDLHVQRGLQLSARRDLFLLCGLQRRKLVCFCALFGLSLGQVLLEILLHLLKHTIDLPAAWGVTLITRDCQKGIGGIGLRQERPQHRGIGHRTRTPKACAELQNPGAAQPVRCSLQEARLRVIFL